MRDKQEVMARGIMARRVIHYAQLRLPAPDELAQYLAHRCAVAGAARARFDNRSSTAIFETRSLHSSAGLAPASPTIATAGNPDRLGPQPVGGSELCPRHREHSHAVMPGGLESRRRHPRRSPPRVETVIGSAVDRIAGCAIVAGEPSPLVAASRRQLDFLIRALGL
jgi:hypothetical protein